MKQGSEYFLPAWLWLVLPLLIMFSLICVLAFFPAYIDPVIDLENGPVELGTSIILFPGIFTGILIFRLRNNLPSGWLLYWFVIVTLGCIYIAGEEISWGQQIWKWGTPEYFRLMNDQQETNIHNMSSWFDQKPRMLLELWVLIGGVLLVLWRIIRSISYGSQDWRYWFWPSVDCFPAALIAILARGPERYQRITGDWPLPVHARFSEVQELYFSIFLTLYLLSVYRKLKMKKAGK